MRLTADDERQRISVGGWSRSVKWLDPRWRDGFRAAELRFRSDVSLLLEWGDSSDDVHVTLWTGEPWTSPGAAVVLDGERLEGVAPVPRCGCGEQGCSDASYQLDVTLPADELPELVRLLQSLPTAQVKPGSATTWTGDWFEA